MKLMNPSDALSQLWPLPIEENRGNLSNYKEPWCSQNMNRSVKNTGMYEAGGSLYWLDYSFCTLDDSDKVLTEEPSMHEILEAELIHLPEKEGERLYFDDALACYGVEANLTGTCPGKLRLMHRRKILYSWYLAMARALHQSDDARVQQLHQCALTVTLRLHLRTTGTDLLLNSLRLSEKMKAGEAGDSFQLFAKKLGHLADEKNVKMGSLLPQLSEDKISFNKAPVNKTMLAAAEKLYSVLTPGVERALLATQREFGRSIWSQHYNNLMRLVQICGKQIQTWGRGDLAELVEACLQAGYIALKRGQVDASFFTLSKLDSRGESVGWVQATCVKILLVQNVLEMARLSLQTAAGQQTEDERQKLLHVLDGICSPLGFDKSLPHISAQAPDTSSPKGPDEDTRDDIEMADPIEGLTNGLAKHLRNIVVLVRDLWEGDYERDLWEFAGEKNPTDKIMRGSESELAKAFRTASSEPWQF